MRDYNRSLRHAQARLATVETDVMGALRIREMADRSKKIKIEPTYVAGVP